MKIGEARKIYSSQLDTLWNRKRELTAILKEGPKEGMDSGRYDTVELSKELSEVDKEYGQMKDFMEQLTMKEMGLHNAAAAKQQGEAVAKAMDDMMKCLEIARRISEGAKVPPEDEKKLMEYNHELYMMSKNMGFAKEQTERKEYSSLFPEEEGGQEEPRDASEIASEAEVGMELPELISESVPSESE